MLVRHRPTALGLLALVALALIPACAGPGTERHLAPFYSRHSTVHGTVDSEALGGVLHSVRHQETGTKLIAAARPLYSWHAEGEEDWRSYFLAPLGYSYSRDGETLSLLLPVYLYREGERADGTREKRLASLPGLLYRDNSERGKAFGWFPFLGKLESFLTYDEVFFFLWPLYATVNAGERHSKHILYPFLGWTTGGGERSFHIFPFYLRSRMEGRYDRLAILWPFFQYQRNRLGGGGEEPETVLWFWPLWGKVERGTYRADTVLWPFFGYARDPRGDFWAVDAFAPLVRFQRGGQNTAETSRSRIWPFFGFLEGEKIESKSYLWPIVHVREERYLDSERDSFHIIPFWQSWDRKEYATGRKSSWRKLWPLYVVENEGSRQRGAFPELDPFQRNQLVAYHYSYLWRLWSWERDREAGIRRERAWLNLWRRERDAHEDRRSFTFLWAKRDYRDNAGGEVSETSLLFGLLRWRRTEDDGFDMLSPAFPGPGWPAARRGPGNAPDPRQP
ncbi:MAG: hypothetical protein AAF682_28605 [Planctomycetota bacterium]